jgi:hypothetical protein
MLREIVAVICVAFGITAASTPAVAQSTAFTYQGELRQGATLAGGLHDLRFRLFDAASGGAQFGTTACVNNVRVIDGRFTATIDFGQQFATAAGRFLEIEVRADTGLDCGNTSGFVVLTPRQALTASPLANHAKSAFALDAADGSPANAVFVDNSGKVGVGTTAPTHTVHIASSAPTLALQDTDSTTQQVGYISYRDSANAERAWIGYGTVGSQVFSIVNARPTGHIALLPFAGGNVGIGTEAPAAKLDVRGDIRLGSRGELRAASSEENLRLVRGSVYSDGTVEYGAGFTSTRISEGTYEIRFTPPFARTPTVIAQAAHNYPADMCWATVYGEGPGNAYVHLRTSRTNWVDAAFSIIIMGPR